MKQNSSNWNTAIELCHENVNETEDRLKQTVKYVILSCKEKPTWGTIYY